MIMVKKGEVKGSCWGKIQIKQQNEWTSGKEY